MNIKILVFRVIGNTESPFTTSIIDSQQQIEENIEWLPSLESNIEGLNQVFNTQLKRNATLFNKIYLDLGGNLDHNFHRTYVGYLKCFSIDELVMNQQGNDWDIKVQVVVAIDESNQYLGHIYLWESPHNPTMILIKGLRSRSDNLLIDKSNRISVSIGLLSTVIAYAETNGYKTISYIQPDEILEKPLMRLGFSKLVIDAHLCGNGIIKQDSEIVHVETMSCSILESMENKNE